MSLYLALYKGPPSDLLHIIGHNATRLWTWSKYSHAELVIDGVCWSSSARDGGVRSKVIDLDSGKWDVVKLTDNLLTKYNALLWFKQHEGDEYDYRNILRFVIPIVGHDKRKWVCYEACAAALGIKNPHKLDADKLLEEALKLK